MNNNNNNKNGVYKNLKPDTYRDTQAILHQHTQNFLINTTKSLRTECFCFSFFVSKHNESIQCSAMKNEPNDIENLNMHFNHIYSSRPARCRCYLETEIRQSSSVSAYKIYKFFFITCSCTTDLDMIYRGMGESQLQSLKMLLGNTQEIEKDAPLCLSAAYEYWIWEQVQTMYLWNASFLVKRMLSTENLKILIQFARTPSIIIWNICFNSSMQYLPANPVYESILIAKILRNFVFQRKKNEKEKWEKYNGNLFRAK